MPQVVPWPPGDGAMSQPRSHAVETCRRHLLRGELVALPTEAGYVAAASATHAEAVARLAGLRTGDAPLPAVAVRGEADARDWVPDLGPVARRIARRGWPGPLVLLFTHGVKVGAGNRLPDGVLRTIAPGWELGLISSLHPAVRQTLENAAFPLVLGEVAGEPVATADDIAAAIGDAAAVIVDSGPTQFAKPATVVEVGPDKWSIRREGVVPAAELARLAAQLILFICTGNTCRSPLAAALCQRMLADRLGCAIEELTEQGFLITSAGLAAVRGEPAAPEAVAVARDLGADLSGHASRPATPDLLSEADLVVGMTAGHLGGLEGIVNTDARMRLLCGDTDLADPIGGDMTVYQTCAGAIWQHLPALVDELLANAGRQPGSAGISPPA
jgi:protein-tyrosine phosphatase